MDKNNTKILLINLKKAQQILKDYVKKRRVLMGLTQKGLALRSGVKLATLRKFEQKGTLSLASFLKLLVILGDLEKFINIARIEEEHFSSIKEVLKENLKDKKRAKRGRRT